jgi:alpha-tubulin suppressor-like RCC1 family protein
VVTVTAPSMAVSSVSGMNSTFAIKSDGTLWAWGSNLVGRLGIGTLNSTPNPIPVEVPHPATASPGTTWNAVSVNNHTMAIRSDGTLWAWGANGAPPDKVSWATAVPATAELPPRSVSRGLGAVCP